MVAVKKFITIDKDIQFGKPVFKGTRVPVESLIDHLDKGINIDEFLEDFPTVKKEQVMLYLKLKDYE
ncbi:DUF433 domain-containing protein [uncultured Mucilaginibacter sp.]|uniref:DUF433 domain-containing protein n=1 Tax=uncultured Mucilaginibacter sp. TaxID=797541 RepID=UPI0025D17F67|nr:DUF433 domain-containing protein [uncultured Mucilaginibacter sp.]